MKKILLICGTHYQFILALQMKMTLFKFDIVDLLLTTSTKGFVKLYENFKDNEIFNSTYLIDNDEIEGNNVFVKNKLKNLIAVIDGNISKIKTLSFFYNGVYDEVFFFNETSLLLQLMYSYCQDKKLKTIFNKYEEGVLSYNYSFKNKKVYLANLVRKFLNKKCIKMEEVDFYCCYPEVLNKKLFKKSIKIPLIKDFKIISEIYSNIYGMDFAKNSYKEKYIYLSSVCDFQGNKNIGEYELVKQIEKIVGTENLIVKIHPRDNRGIYEKSGLHYDKNSEIPWEVLQISMDMSDKIILTATSGSALSINMLLENGPMTYFLYNFCRNIQDNYLAKQSVNNIKNLFNNKDVLKYMKNILVVKSQDELKEVLK